MPIKVVCVTMADGHTRERVILEKATTAANMIAIADRYLALHQQHALANGLDFVDLRCVLDDVHVPTRLFIESCSTFFHLARVKLFGESGFALYKHDADVECFMSAVMAGAHLGGMPAPKWMGGKLKQSSAKTKLSGPAAPAAPEVSKSSAGAVNEQPTPNAKPTSLPNSTTPVEPGKTRRKLSPANLGNLGNI
ncbi:hypothetical protein ACEN2T_17685 [Pseudomonas sp. W22_MBD1_FP4]|uniref:hypothetical protein n=1 Tax=Pseudomonas sp. W22_MBD1_FP4 TaxID=3240272 RepID=UPI003F9B390B